jgi:hypothetical protein
MVEGAEGALKETAAMKKANCHCIASDATALLCARGGAYHLRGNT